jgi:hypothetical protein
MDRTKREQLVVARWVPPIALWLANKLLQTPRAHRAMRRADIRVEQQVKRAVGALRQRARNMRSNSHWLAAGAGSIAVGLGLLARSTKR